VTVTRTRLPEPAPSPQYVFPAVDKSTLSNGLRIWTVRHSQIPIVAFMLLVRCGAAADPPGKEGLAAATADMFDEGTGDGSAIDMHEAIARLGAQFDIDIGSDGTVVSLTLLSRFADRGLALLADMVARPAMREGDFARVRQLRLHRLTQIRDLPSAVADRAFLRLVYGTHPYGHTPIGSEASLASMTIEDVRAFHAAAIRPSEAILIAVGDCDHAVIERLARESFSHWTGVADDPPDPTADLPRGPRLNIIPRPQAPQSELRIGQVGVDRKTPDYHALLVANAILGGQFVSRINLNLREDKGVTYGARTAFEYRRWRGPFVLQVSVQTSATGRAIEESIREIADIRGPRPATTEELSLGISGITRGYARNFETADQIARAVMQLALYELPDDYFVEFVPRIERVTIDEVSRVMRQHLDPARLTTLVVGDLDAVEADLRRLGQGDPVVVPRDSF
jgi:zinc protease